jgi:hypothetical protein
LKRHGRADEILFWWASLASLDEVRDWLVTQLKTPRDAAWVLSLLMNRASRNGEARYYIKPSFVQKYVETETIETALRNIDEKRLPEKQRIAVRESRLALRRKREGKPELDTGRTFEIEEE